MSNFPARYLVVLLFIMSGSVLWAQTSTTSNPNAERENNPYSRYGIGELWNGNSTTIKGMANITSAYQDPYEVNSDNPASYTSLVLTTFEGGLIASRRNISANSGISYTTSTVSLGYMSIGVPVGKHAGMAFGLRPFSKMYYALVDTSITPIGRTLRSYAGDGGLSYAYIGGAYRYRGLSVGFNFGYLFGNYRNFTSVSGIDTLAINNAYEAQFQRFNNIGGIYWKSGFTYQTKLRDSNFAFTLGGTLSLGQNVNDRASNYKVSIYNFGDTLVNDTVFKSTEQQGKLKMPLSYSIGIMLSKTDKWSFGLDYSASDWSNFNSTVDSTRKIGIASQSYKFAGGGQFTPNSADITSYFSRVTYRFGVYYGMDYVRVQSTTLPNYGVTLGGSFPYKRKMRTASRLSASLDIGRLGTVNNGLLKQTYVRFGLGLTFNEKWFIPRKYD